jgi:hypothetical protein
MDDRVVRGAQPFPVLGEERPGLLVVQRGEDP